MAQRNKGRGTLKSQHETNAGDVTLWLLLQANTAGLAIGKIDQGE
jgi:hypothetical protein